MAGQLKEELVLKTGQFSQGINSAISEVEKLKKKGNELGSGFDKSLGGIISKLKGFNAAALVGLAAGKALGEAMKRNAAINDTFNSSITMCKSGLETFYSSLGKMDFNNFINNVENAAKSAREAYYALNELETTKTFNQMRIKELEVMYERLMKLSKDRNLSEKDRLRYLLQAKNIMNQQLKIQQEIIRLTNDASRKQLRKTLNENSLGNITEDKAISMLRNLSNTRASAEYYERKNKEWQNKINSSKIGSFGGSYTSKQTQELNRQYQQWQNNQSVKVLKERFDFYQLLKNNPKGIEEFQDLIIESMNMKNQAENSLVDIDNEEFKINTKITNELEKQEKIVERIKEQWQNAYNKSIKFSEELQKETKDINVNDNTRISSMSVYDKLKSQQYQDLVNQGKGKFTTENNGGIKTHDKQGFEVYFKMNDESVEDIYTKYNRLVQRVQEAMKDSDIGILSAEEVNATIEKINEEIEKLGLKPLELHVKTDAEKALSKVSQEIGQVASAFGQLGQAFEEPALNVAATMAQAIATIIQGYATASAQAATLGPWAWLGFSLTALGELASIISSVKSMGQYANGGVVGGSSYSGDRLYARVNSGEMILNSQQQSHLFNMINNGGTNAVNGNVKFVIKGTDLQGVLNNYNHKMGKVR